jgi:hypothetical protein
MLILAGVDIGVAGGAPRTIRVPETPTDEEKIA